MLLSGVLYAGLVGALLGAASLVHPLAALGISGRAQGAIVATVGLTLAVLALAWPARIVRSPTTSSHLDRLLRDYQFGEVHHLRIRAPATRVFQALKDVRADEITFYRALTWIRAPRLPSDTRPGILNPPAGRPLLEGALASGFVLLAESPPRELVFGVPNLLALREDGGRRTPPAPGARLRSPHENTAAFVEPGPAHAVKVAMNFVVDEEADGWCTLRTETRVLAADDNARRRFAAYWRLILPGSDVIRRTWLRAIRARAEGSPDDRAGAPSR